MFRTRPQTPFEMFASFVGFDKWQPDRFIPGFMWSIPKKYCSGSFPFVIRCISLACLSIGLLFVIPTVFLIVLDFVIWVCRHILLRIRTGQLETIDHKAHTKDANSKGSQQHNGKDSDHKQPGKKAKEKKT